MIDKLYKLAWIPILLIVTVIAWPFVAPRLGIGGGNGERRRDLDPFREHLASAVAGEVAERLPRADELHVLLVPPVEGDATKWLQETLAEAILEHGFYEDVVDAEDVAGKRKEKLADKEPLSREDWLMLAREMKADGVLFGRAATFTDGRRGVGARLDLAVELVRAKDGALVPDGKVAVERVVTSRASLDYFTPWMLSMSRILRFLLWVVFAGGLPFALYPLVQWVARLESNKSAAGLVVLMTAADVVLGVALMGFAPGGIGIGLIVIGGIVAGIYNLGIGDLLAR